MVVGELLDELGGHVEWGTLDRSQYDRVGGHGASESKITEFDDAVG